MGTCAANACSITYTYAHRSQNSTRRIPPRVPANVLDEGGGLVGGDPTYFDLCGVGGGNRCRVGPKVLRFGIPAVELLAAALVHVYGLPIGRPATAGHGAPIQLEQIVQARSVVNDVVDAERHHGLFELESVARGSVAEKHAHPPLVRILER